MKKPTKAAAPKDGSFRCCDPAFLSLYPALADLTCNPFYSGGEARVLSKLKISFGPDSVGVLVDDPSSDSYAFCTADGFTEALVLLDSAVANGSVSWRKSTWKKNK